LYFKYNIKSRYDQLANSPALFYKKTVGFAHTHKLFKKSLIKNFIENRISCGFLEKTITITQL